MVNNDTFKRVTVTVTPTATNLLCPSTTPDTSCGNPGLEWAYYTNEFVTNDLSTYDPVYYKTQLPGEAEGVTTNAGGISGTCASTASKYSFYGHSELCDEFTLNYRGYIYAPQTGTFTITVTAAKNLLLVWAGPDAYSGYMRDNAIIDVTYNTLPAGGKPANYAANAGDYIPLRIMFSQGSGPFEFDVKVTAPDGTVILSDSSAASEYLVWKSYDGTAPPYPAFGSET
jgi:hypothetical protein